MQTKPIVSNVAPSKEETQQQDENMQSWIELFEELYLFGQKTPGANSPYRMKVFADSSYLKSYETKKMRLSKLNHLDLNDEHMIFCVACGVNDEGIDDSPEGDIQFRFCHDHCQIWSWHHGGEHSQSDTIDEMVKTLLQFEDVSSIRTIGDSKPLLIDGLCYHERVSLKDGLIVLKHWRELITPLMKKEKSVV